MQECSTECGKGAMHDLWVVMQGGNVRCWSWFGFQGLLAVVDHETKGGCRMHVHGLQGTWGAVMESHVQVHGVRC